MSIKNFTKKLLVWYDLNKRDLPWRNSINPYIIWVSEIILQQTRIEQGLPYFKKFINKYPNVFELSMLLKFLDEYNPSDLVLETP